MSNADDLAALVRILQSMDYIDIDPERPEWGTRWTVIDGSNHIDTADADVLERLLRVARTQKAPATPG